MRDRPAIRLGAGELARDLDQSHALLAPYARLRWARPGSGWYTHETVLTGRTCSRLMLSASSFGGKYGDGRLSRKRPRKRALR